MDLPLLPIAYFPSVTYFSKLNANPSVGIEFFEHFVKQSYRNRCCIYSPNGKQNLVVPLQQRSERTLTKDIRIAYNDNWAKNHWRSLEAAYRRSAYFEFYEDDIRPLLLDHKHEFLMDLNLEIIHGLLSIFNISCELCPTVSYDKDVLNDFRDAFSPKKKHEKQTLQHPIYSQVFDQKHGHIADLSILDLLFNQGPRSLNYLQPETV